MDVLAATEHGSGPSVLLVHGGMSVGGFAWAAQTPLAERWALRIVDRAGYGGSAELSEGEDIELDARLVSGSLTELTHLVGHSSGAIAVMLAAAMRPEVVRSLTVVEPPSYRFVDDAEVQALADEGERLWADSGTADRAWLLRFFEVYAATPPPEPVLAMFEPHVPAFRRFIRRPWEISLPVDDIRRAQFPTLVVSGGHSDAFERLNDRIAEATGARRAVVRGAGHAVQMTGQPFNDVLEEFWADAASS